MLLLCRSVNCQGRPARQSQEGRGLFIYIYNAVLPITTTLNSQKPTTMTPTPSRHYFCIPIALNGHLRPLFNLALNALRTHDDLAVTFLAHTFNRGLVEADLTRYASSEDFRERLHIWWIGPEETDKTQLMDHLELHGTIGDIIEALPSIYGSLMHVSDLNRNRMTLLG